MQRVPRVGDAETTGDLVAVEDVAGRVTVHADTEGVLCSHDLERRPSS